MNLLIIGGTLFVGRHLVEAALARGHAVTLFHRGRHGAELFPEADRIQGDRDGAGLNALTGRAWDAVIDTCGYVPRIVRQSAELLAGSADRYVFISTVSVYRDFVTVGIDESYPVGTLDDSTVEEVTGETYGPLKALCEQAVSTACPGRTLIIRPGLIVGPYDTTGRFTYWPRRVAEGGDVLAPGLPTKRLQCIDVRDLAAWTIAMIEQRLSGVFNAVSTDETWTMGRLLADSLAVSGSEARLTWADESWLLSQGVQPWSDLPLWLPDTAEYAGMDAISAASAVRHGLTLRPLQETIADTLAWDASLPADQQVAAGISRERERELLQKYTQNFMTP